MRRNGLRADARHRARRHRHRGPCRRFAALSHLERRRAQAHLDHSPVGEQEDQGELTESQAMSHPRRNEVFRDVGSRERTVDDQDFVEIKSFPLHSGAALVLCTDGLSDALTAAEIGQIVERYSGEPEQVTQWLVDAANERGGSDNISVIFIAGPDFIGVHSPAMSEARARHGITRMRTGRRIWKGILVRLVWLVIGIALGVFIGWRYIH